MIIKKVKSEFLFVIEDKKKKKTNDSYTGGASSGMNVENPDNDNLADSKLEINFLLIFR